MLLVDISVPAVDKTYNFKLNEEVEISSIIGEIVDMIARKEQTSLRGEEGKSEQELAGELSLYYVSRQQVLPRNSTLAECGIPVGSLLMLVKEMAACGHSSQLTCSSSGESLQGRPLR